MAIWLDLSAVGQRTRYSGPLTGNQIADRAAPGSNVIAKHLAPPVTGAQILGPAVLEWIIVEYNNVTSYFDLLDPGDGAYIFSTDGVLGSNDGQLFDLGGYRCKGGLDFDFDGTPTVTVGYR